MHLRLKSNDGNTLRPSAMRLFWLLVSFAIIIRLIMVIVLPFGESVRFRLEGLNDEPSHYNYIKYLNEHRRFPVQVGTARDSGAFERDDFEYYQPPLYYTIGALLHCISGDTAGFYLCRLLSFFCGIATIVVIGTMLKPATLSVRYGAMLFTALLPTHAYFCSFVSNDAASWLFSALITRELFIIIRGNSDEFTWKRTVTISIYLALGMLTKTSLALFYPLFGAVAIFLFIKKPSTATLVKSITAISIALILIVPWYMRNAHLYGSITALTMGFGEPEAAVFSFRKLAGIIISTIHYFWFPMQHIPRGTIIVGILNRIGAGIILVHLGIALVSIFCSRKFSITSSLLTLLFALALGAHLHLNILFSEPEGRFLLPALPAIALFFAWSAECLSCYLKKDTILLFLEITLITLYPYSFLFVAL